MYDEIVNSHENKTYSLFLLHKSFFLMAQFFDDTQL